jgi:serine/threonine-protein kinase
VVKEDPTPVDPLVGTVLDGRYRIVEQLGEGGMGAVYRAERLKLGDQVALKILREGSAPTAEMAKRFKREVQVMSRLAHPHLTAVLDSGVSASGPYLVMELLRGRSLGQVLKEGVDARRAVGITRQMLSGARYAHAGGVVHRDLKPENVFVLDGDFVKILDFGLARIARGEGEDASALTRDGHALGTPSYMSPEQAKGLQADRRSDLYSIGVLLYCMVCGRKPFRATSPVDVLRMHIAEPPPPPREVRPGACSAALEKVILRALEKPPAKRWQSADEFARALEATPEGRESSVPLIDLRDRDTGRRAALPSPAQVVALPSPAQVRAVPRRRRLRRGQVALLVLALSLLGLAAWAKLDPVGAARLRAWISSATAR